MKTTKLEYIKQLGKRPKLLKQLKQEHQEEYIRKRLKIVELIWKGYSRLDILTLLQIKGKCLDTWMNVILDHGIEEGLHIMATPKKREVPWRISEEQQQELKKMILEKSPQDYGYDQFIWTAHIIIDLIKKRWDIDYKDSRIYEILDALHISHQKAHRDYARADLKKQKRFVWRIKKKLRNLSRHEHLMFHDEFAFSSRPSLFYNWALKNTHPKVKTFQGSWKKLNGFLTVDAVTGEEYFQASPVSKSEALASYFAHLLQDISNRGIQKVTLVLDQGPNHKTPMKRSLRKLLKQKNIFVHLHFMSLPAYSPDYNLVEYCIHLCRQKLLHHHTLEFDFEKLVTRVKNYFRRHSLLSPSQVKNILHHIFKLPFHLRVGRE